eukprot:jgi/Chrpa1/28085/Chrysochromulina_OHIO_Genome00017429-RA
MHSHFLPARWPDFAARHGGEAWPWMRHSGQPAGTFGYGRQCNAMLMQGEREFRPVTRACWDAAERVADMDKACVDLQLISATPILFQWQRPPKVALDVARHFNDAALEMCASRDAQGRLLPLCQVPLQSVDDACLEVERAMAAGHVGVQIGNHVGTRDLDADELVAFLSHCASIRAPVLVHPWDMDDLDGRLTKYMMGWTVGMPMETHLSITAMILGGAFDRLPRELDLCFAHGGGAFAFLLGRLENAWHHRENAKGKAIHPPSHYLDRFSVDSAVFDARALRLLIDTFGAHRVMLGSDYPFPLGEQLVGDLSSRGVHSPPTRGGHTALTRGADKTPSSQPYTPPVAHAAAGLSRVPVRAGRTAVPVRTWSALSRMPKRSYATAAAASGAGGLNHVLNFIDGQPLAATGGSLPLIDAATGRVRGSVAASSAADVDAAVDAAGRALSRGEWAATSMAARAAVLQRAADLLDAESEAFAQAEAADVGKPVALARALDVPRAAANLRMFAGLVCHGELSSARHGGGGDRSGGLDDALNYTVRKPVGVVGLITPWNLPLYLLTWKLAPALAMGNAVVAKPSELTPTTASMLARVLERAGLPPGVFNVVHGTGAAVGAALCAHPRVGAISFTGGTATGSLVAAAVAPRFAKLSLELGGKNPLLVFADCDLELAVQGAVRASFLNSGQICLCASRILVEDTADGFYERFAAAFANAASALKLGAPTDPSADIGPLVSAAQRDKVSALYRAAVGTDGVRTLAGGLEDPRAAIAAHGAHQGGHWFAPTVLDGLPMDAPLPQTEAFGPLVTIHPFTSEVEAVELANATQYGLAASVWTEDLSRAHTIASRLEAGTVWGGGVRALNTGATGYVASAPKPMGAYAHAREAGGLLFLAGIGPRDPATDSVPGGPVEAADGTLNDYDARAQTRQCIQNVRTVLEAHGLGLDAVVDVHAFLVDMKRDFAAFNAEYAAAFGKLPEPPVRTTVEVGQLPPGGRIAVELKVIAKAPSVYFVPGGIPDCVKE